MLLRLLVTVLAGCGTVAPPASLGSTCFADAGPPVPLTLPTSGAPVSLEVAPLGDAWEVAWRVEGAPLLLMARTDGVVVPGEGVVRTLARLLSAESRVSLDAGGAFVAWTEDRGQVVVQALDASGEPDGPARDTLVTGFTPRPGPAELAVAGSVPWLVVRQGTGDDASWRLVDATRFERAVGLPFGAREATLARAPGAAPFVVWIDGEDGLRTLPLSEEGFGTVQAWPGLAGGADRLEAVRVGDGLVVALEGSSGPRFVSLPSPGASIVPPVDARSVRLWGGERLVAAWNDTTGAVRLGRPGEGCGPVEVVPSGEDRVVAFAVAATASSALVAWTAVDADGRARLWVRRFTDPGAPPATR